MYALEVGRRLRAWRVIRRLSQQEVAARAGVERELVRATEQAAVSVDVTRLRRLAWAVGVPLPELVDEDWRAPTCASRIGSGSGPAPRRR